MLEPDPNLAAIKMREQAVRDAIHRGDRDVETGAFGASQLRLSPVVADEWGKLWRVDGDKLVLVYNPWPRKARW